MDTQLLWTAFIAGLLSFLSPCALPSMIAYLGYVAGTGEKATRKMRCVNALGLILGLTIVFVLFGFGAGMLGQEIEGHLKNIRWFSGVLLLFFGLMLLGAYRLPLLSRFSRSVQFRPPSWLRPTLWGSILLGMIFAFAWGPCVGPILGTLLTFAVTTGSWQQDTLLFLVYSGGLALPLMALALFFEPIRMLLQRIRWFALALRYLAGALFILLGVGLLTGKLESFMQMFS